jgi:phosphoglucosamine mutase
MLERLFGTDGVRGTANAYPITPDIVMKIGQALGYILVRSQGPHKSDNKRVVIGKDTRLSGYMVEMALASGLNSMGVHVQLVGPLPTPGIGFLTQNMRADAGIVISASHNPYYDNGIKIFGPDGFKISEKMEKEIESLVLNENLNSLLPKSAGIGRSKRIEDSAGRYIVFVKNTFPLDLTLDGLRIVLDCANGAAYKVGPAILEELGAEVIVLGNKPDGTNINDKCGALHPNSLSQNVVQYRADCGISLDGDADRVILADEKGNIVNGDHVLAICALDMKARGQLKNDTVVATEMSNFGLEKMLNANNIKLIKTNVGDKYVVQEMRTGGHSIGGEQSGHIIFLEHATTGDGLIAALKVLAVMKRQSRSLSDLNNIMIDMPQILKNIKVGARKPLEDIEGYQALHDKISKELKGQGRIFVRFSGTEPLVRVLVEGPDIKRIHQYADEMSAFLQKSLG